jgi:hypothetical protein
MIQNICHSIELFELNLLKSFSSLNSKALQRYHWNTVSRELTTKIQKFIQICWSNISLDSTLWVGYITYVFIFNSINLVIFAICTCQNIIFDFKMLKFLHGIENMNKIYHGGCIVDFSSINSILMQSYISIKCFF